MGKKDFQKEHTETLLDEYVIARYESHGEHFEVLIEPDAVEKFRSGKDIDLEENMPADKVFTDAKKGKVASNAMIRKIFETEEIEEIAKKIIEEGEVQITTEQRKKRQEQKRKEIVNRIVRNSYNPQTKTPHPPQRIENAMTEVNVHIDSFKPVSKQVDKVVDGIKGLIPLSFKKLTFSVLVRGDLYGKIYGYLKEIGRIESEEWLNDGRWQGIIKIPAGLQDELYEKINNKTHGDAVIELIDK
ncbi:MAG: ribosome assembly factor SBDS [Thermoplasmata archaeon]